VCVCVCMCGWCIWFGVEEVRIFYEIRVVCMYIMSPFHLCFCVCVCVCVCALTRHLNAAHMRVHKS